MKYALRKPMMWALGVAALSFASLNVAFAQSITLTNPLGGQSFSSVVNSVISFIQIDIATPLCVILALVGAFQLMTSAGDPEKTSKGRKTLMWTAIGYVIVWIAGGLALLLQSIINGH